MKLYYFFYFNIRIKLLVVFYKILINFLILFKRQKEISNIAIYLKKWKSVWILIKKGRIILWHPYKLRFLLTWSQFQSCTFVAPQVRWYSSNGGSIKITSNLQFNSFKLYESKSVLRYMGGVAVSAIKSSFNLINSRNFGYSSNLSAKPTSLIKFCGRWPVSMKCWQ